MYYSSEFPVLNLSICVLQTAPIEVEPWLSQAVRLLHNPLEEATASLLAMYREKCSPAGTSTEATERVAKSGAASGTSPGRSGADIAAMADPVIPLPSAAEDECLVIDEGTNSASNASNDEATQVRNSPSFDPRMI